MATKWYQILQTWQARLVSPVAARAVALMNATHVIENGQPRVALRLLITLKDDMMRLAVACPRRLANIVGILHSLTLHYPPEMHTLRQLPLEMHMPLQAGMLTLREMRTPSLLHHETLIPPLRASPRQLYCSFMCQTCNML